MDTISTPTGHFHAGEGGSTWSTGFLMTETSQHVVVSLRETRGHGYDSAGRAARDTAVKTMEPTVAGFQLVSRRAGRSGEAAKGCCGTLQAAT